MLNFKEEIAKLIAQQVEGLELAEIQDMIEVPQDHKMGDYAFPCFKLAKTLRKAPPLIAKGIAEGMADADLFPHIYVWSSVWQGTGWGTIIYLSALAGADPQLYEAATLDGASKLQRIIHLDIPTLMPTAVIMLILNSGNVLTCNTQKVLLLQNGMNLSTSEIIGTLVYKSGMVDMQYSYSTAVGLFQTIINVIILLTVNKIAGKLSETSLW